MNTLEEKILRKKEKILFFMKQMQSDCRLEASQNEHEDCKAVNNYSKSWNKGWGKYGK